MNRVRVIKMLEEFVEYLLLIQIWMETAHQSRSHQLQFREVVMKVTFKSKIFEDSAFPSQMGLI